MFHRFTAGDLEVFWGVLLCVCLCFWGFVWFVWLFAFHDFEVNLVVAKLNDRLSCHGAHGMGEKKKSHSILASIVLGRPLSTSDMPFFHTHNRV